jgi:hypothetical protein
VVLGRAAREVNRFLERLEIGQNFVLNWEIAIHLIVCNLLNGEDKTFSAAIQQQMDQHLFRHSDEEVNHGKHVIGYL